MEGIMRRRDLSLRGIILSTHTGPYVPTPSTIASLSQPRARSPYTEEKNHGLTGGPAPAAWRGSGAFGKPPAGRAPRRRGKGTRGEGHLCRGRVGVGRDTVRRGAYQLSPCPLQPSSLPAPDGSSLLLLMVKRGHTNYLVIYLFCCSAPAPINNIFLS